MRAEIKSEAPSLSHYALVRRYGVTADRSHRPPTRHGTLTPAQEIVAMEIGKLLTDNGSQFTDRFTHRGTIPSGSPLSIVNAPCWASSIV